MRSPDRAASSQALYASIRNASELTGVSETRINVLLKAGTLRAKRLDGRVLIDMEHARGWLQSLPNWQSNAAA